MGKLFLLFLIVVAAAFTIPKTRAMVLKEASPLVNKFKARIVTGRLKTMVDELVSTEDRGEPLPTGVNDWAGWLQGDYTSDPVDPWGHKYYLEIQSNGFLVGSMGPDGVKDNADDITMRHINPAH